MAVDKRLPPIRPPAKVPLLWRKRPDLAPPRRTANANFLGVNVVAGVATRFPFHPTCGARTKNGTKCKAPKVAGGSRCRYHGGGGLLLRRARQTLAITRSRSVAAKCLWYIEKSVRNRSRQHLKAGEAEFARREADAEQASRIITRAEQDGVASVDLIRRLYQLGNKVRPYREHDIHCAAGAYCDALISGEPPLARFEAFAFALRLSEHERLGVAPTLGVQRLTRPEIKNPVDAVDQVFAVRSDVRRVRRRQLRRPNSS
jgi:hypothetical protein